MYFLPRLISPGLGDQRGWWVPGLAWGPAGVWGRERLACGAAQRQEDVSLRNNWVDTSQLISVYESGWCPGVWNGSKAPETSSRKWLRSVLLLSTGSLPPSPPPHWVLIPTPFFAPPPSIALTLGDEWTSLAVKASSQGPGAPGDGLTVPEELEHPPLLAQDPLAGVRGHSVVTCQPTPPHGDSGVHALRSKPGDNFIFQCGLKDTGEGLSWQFRG